MRHLTAPLEGLHQRTRRMVESRDDRKVTPAVIANKGDKKKNIILVRHAQSMENVKVTNLCDGIARIKNFQLPTWKQITSTLSLLSLTRDSLVSDLGKRQISDMHRILSEEKFWDCNVDLIICSPLTRAKDTCDGILPVDNKALKVRILDDLEEASIYEHCFSSTLIQRIDRFKYWLSQTEEKTIVIVGHSQYFKKMLGLKTLMRNCDVWQCEYSSNFLVHTANSSSSVRTDEWSNLNLLHRTSLADVHPYDKLTNKNDGAGRCKEDLLSNTYPAADEGTGQEIGIDSFIKSVAVTKPH